MLEAKDAAIVLGKDRPVRLPIVERVGELFMEYNLQHTARDFASFPLCIVNSFPTPGAISPGPHQRAMPSGVEVRSQTLAGEALIG